MDSSGLPWVFFFTDSLDVVKENAPLTRLKEKGPYPSLRDLYDAHVRLLREDFLWGLREQLNRSEDLESNHYMVTAANVRIKMLAGGTFPKTIGIEFHFDPSEYAGVDLTDDKRLMRNNMVLLLGGKRDLERGVILESGKRNLEKGKIVLAIIKRFDPVNGYPLLEENQEQFLGMTFKMIESEAFHFPYLYVTRVLSEEILHGGIKEWAFNQYDPSDHARLDKIMGNCSYQFEEEIVRGVLPSRPPGYMHDERTADTIQALQRSFRRNVNTSQMVALKKALMYRVALIQGPPGTGKTFIGTKAAQLFVEAKRRLPDVFPGPVLLVAASNQVVQGFLVRCREFTDKAVHSCGVKHERDPVEYGPLQDEHDKAKFHAKSGVLERAEIIGMTTTRAACIKDTLDQLKIKIVIVEEAAELLEAHVLASLPYGAEHFLQIGDHRQLRPSYAHMQFAKDYNLQLSLFERLVNNGADCPMLSEQRRMRPSIADLVRCVYPNLADHESTRDRPRVEGVDLDEPVFFIDHAHPESKEGTSYKNIHEAEMAVELANYLVLQQHAVSVITILTTYRTQFRLIRQLLNDHRNAQMKLLRVSTVDKFQGEENDLIILSLVRCNYSGNVGFLRLANRACVALSRARNGFFMLGSLSCLMATQEPVWLHVSKSLLETGRVGQFLPLQCRHGVKFQVKTAADIRAAWRRCGLCEGIDFISKGIDAATLQDH